jgi:Flp pilus assembly protein TadB
MMRALMGLTLILSVASASAASILLADTAKVEASSAVVQRMRAQALAVQQRKIPAAKTLNDEFSEALELSLSDIRAGIPIAIASIAKAQKADVVLEPAIAKKLGLAGTDISAQVQQRIDQQFAKSVFIAP